MAFAPCCAAARRRSANTPVNFSRSKNELMPLPTYDTLKTEMAEPHVLVVTLNRPQSANALNTQMGRDLLDLWTRLTEDAHDARCVVLTAAGDRIFCAGG